MPRLIDSKSDKRLWILDHFYDDDFGLWEIGVPNAFPELKPGAPDCEIDLLCSLIERGYIGLYFGKIHESERSRRIEINEVRNILSRLESWQPPDGKPIYYLSVEPRGLRFYHACGLG